MLKRVTLTGADDTTPVGPLLDLAREFPFVEFGILASRSQEGTTRFPSRAWIAAFLHALGGMTPHPMVSLHLCGFWVRQMLVGQFNPAVLPEGLLAAAGRVQINTHGQVHAWKPEFFTWLQNVDSFAHEWIFQLDGINNHLLDTAMLFTDSDVTGLWDGSHGGGVSPDDWPPSDGWRGYAGGLGPENVVAETGRIAGVARGDYWIDLETNVRTAGELDLAKGRRVLELTAPVIGRGAAA